MQTAGPKVHPMQDGAPQSDELRAARAGGRLELHLHFAGTACFVPCGATLFLRGRLYDGQCAAVPGFCPTKND